MKRYYFIFTFLFLLAAVIVAVYVITAAFGARRINVYEVSVITRGGGMGYWNAIKLGIDSAVSDLNVELSYITPQNENDSEEQADAIRRELDNGAHAIIIAPCSESPILHEAIEKAAKHVVVIQIEADVTELAGCVLSDNAGMAKMLANELMGNNESCSILIPQNSSLYVNQRVNAIADELDKAGVTWSYSYLTKDTESLPDKQNTWIAPDSDTLQFAAMSGNKSKLCGIGGISSTAYYLDKGIIDFAVVESAFNIGYVAIKAAVDRLSGEKIERIITMDYKLVNSENMYETDNQRILFPFVK